MFSDEIKQQIVIAAATLAGPGADDTTIVAEVRKLIAQLSPGSLALAEFDRAAKRNETLADVKTFRGTVLYVDKEIGSTRGVVFLKTDVNAQNPEGKEFVRTDRTDTPEGRALAVQAQGLVGHVVTVSVRVEQFTDKSNGQQKKVRVLAGISDEGADPNYDANNVEYQPSFSKINTAGLAGFAAQAA